VLKINISCTWT